MFSNTIKSCHFYQNGLVCVWKMDQRGRLQQSPMFQDEVGSHVVEMAFKVTMGADMAV